MEKVEAKKKNGKLEDYEIESKINTLIAAEEIKADKEVMKQLWPKIEQRKKIIGSFDDLLEAKAEIDAEYEDEE